jgi:bacteriocin-like protein
MTEPKPTENLATDELSIDELNSVVGGDGKTAPPKAPPAPPEHEKEMTTFEYQ